MAQENSAYEAPRRGLARAPTGFRRMTPGLLKADLTAKGFAGLPEGVSSPGQLLAAMKAAAPRLGIAPRPGACVRLAVSFYAAAGLGEGRPTGRMALGLDAAGGPRPLVDTSKGIQSPPDRARPGDHGRQPERQALRPPRPPRPHHRSLWL
jgi:hypothetical protein